MLREIIYRNVDRSTFVQIKGKATAVSIWKKLQSIHADKGSMFETDLITQLQTICYSDGNSMHTHLMKMTKLHDCLTEIGTPITDASFNSYIRASLSLTPHYQLLFTALSTTACKAGKPITSTSLVWHLNEEANNLLIEVNINHANTAMIAAHTKGSGSGSRGSGGKGKDKEKSKAGNRRKQCTNCKRMGHVKETCFAKGGGQENDIPDWWKEKQATREKKGMDKTANAASKESTKDKDDNYALLTILASNTFSNKNFALVVTSGHDHQAHSVSPSTGIIIDCSTSSHFSSDRSKFLDYEEINSEPIKAADGHAFSVISKEDICVTLPACKGIQPITVCLKGVYYTPIMAFTLVFISCLDRAGCLLLFEDEICIIHDSHPKQAILGSVPLICGLYHMHPSTLVNPPNSHHANTVDSPMSINELHHHLGHLNFHTLQEMISKGVVMGISLNKSSTSDLCSTCVQGKVHRKAFPKESQTIFMVYGEKVAIDLWGPAQVTSLGGNHYYQLYHDMFTHKNHIDFLKKKLEAFERYLKYKAWVKVQWGAIIKRLRFDGGGEYISTKFINYLKKASTACHLTVYGSPQSNSAAEHGNRTHIEQARSMIIATSLPKFLWAEAVHHSVWLGVQTLSRALPEFITLLEKATGFKSNLKGVLEWGILIWVKKANARKLDPRAIEGRFIEYDEEAKGYHVYWAAKWSVSVEQDVYIDKNAVLEPGDVVFEGEDLPDPNPNNPTGQPSPKKKAPTPPLESIETPTKNPLPESKMPVQPLPRTHHGSLAGLPQYNKATYSYRKHWSAKDAMFIESALVLDDEESLAPGGVIVELPESSNWFHEAVHDTMSAITEDQPHIDEAINRPEAIHWKEAIEAELTQIKKLGTWDIVEAPPDANTIDSQFILHCKRDAQGNISQYNACLVAKGFKQQFGVDYTETFTPTVHASTLCVLLSIAETLGDKVVIEQADAKNAFLNFWLHEGKVIHMALPFYYEAFCSLPTKFANKPRKTIILHLWWPLYGTKQGAHHWYEELRRILLLLGFRVLLSDEAVFIKVEGTKFIIITTATDDFTFIDNSTKSTALIKSQMGEHFELVDLGPVNWLLGVSIVRDIKNQTITLGQEAYIEQILAHFRLDRALLQQRFDPMSQRQASLYLSVLSVVPPL